MNGSEIVDNVTGQTNASEGPSTTLIIIVVCSILGALILVIALIIIIRKRKQRQMAASMEDGTIGITETMQVVYR
jgi:hypothetical protein